MVIIIIQLVKYVKNSSKGILNRKNISEVLKLGIEKFSPNKTAIFGVGNRYRQDDAFGLLVLDALKSDYSQYHLFELSLGVFDLEHIFTSHPSLDLAIFIDAAASKKLSSGTVLIFSPNDILPQATDFTTTTHGISIIDIILLLNSIKKNIMPKKIILIGLVVPNIGYGEGLSPIAQKGIPAIINLVKKILTGQNVPSRITIE
ncbi:MAG: hydrogenase maturation protease [Candidatus Heimdallarchaeota archaeon]|nr:hydrogenase maturation protease [Candidatus Heimdallarchaeota archaeon]